MNTGKSKLNLFRFASTVLYTPHLANKIHRKILYRHQK